MLEVSNITKDFTSPFSLGRIARLDFGRGPTVRALDGVSFSLAKGSILAVLGPNGAGKTTLLKVLSTLIIPDAGTATLNGSRLGKDDDRIRSMVGFSSLQERGFYWRLTGRQNLEFFSALYDMKRCAALKRIDEIAALFKFLDLDKRFDSYSAGMKQAISLMRALVHDPALLLLDEPTKSLDYETARGFMRFVRDELVLRNGKTAIFTTHRPGEASEFADEILMLKNGKAARHE